MSHLYKISEKLKQHTPIIHFQHEQYGATLRATEVKPKLDQFIIEQCLSEKKIDWENAHEARVKFKKIATDIDSKWESWLIGGKTSEHIALDYKLSIEAEAGSMQHRSGIKLMTENNDTSVISKEPISLTIICFHDELKKEIEKQLKAFFVLHNFGKRQNKGWGCFTLGDEKGTSKRDFEKTLKEARLPIFFRKEIQWEHPVKGSWEEQVKIDHQRLKSGLNHNAFKNITNDRNGYEKSKIFEYFTNEKQVGWDKKFMKKAIQKSDRFTDQLYRKTGNVHKDTSSEPSKYVFARALLGLAEHYEFQIDYNGQSDRQKKYKFKVGSKQIERFKSPITFKVFDEGGKQYIYMILNDIPKKLLGHTFQFQLGTRSRRGRIEKDDPNFVNVDPIKTPIAFNLEEFIGIYCEQLNYRPL